MAERPPWIQFLAYFLFILAAWTLFIKYLFPLAFAVASGEPWASHIYWDFWPVAHVWLGWALLVQPGYVRTLAIVMAVVEIAIILTKFVWFFTSPEWDIWRTNWFVNKVFVLGCFILVLLTALFKPSIFRGSDNA
ncbi:hypothetical protein [Microbulbifer aggregans]|uniref:hypothetical protein n=1 Tax=Microbulbifer aggregans TaxID=1769779 RepID=UPI001CFDCF07|nr:hypothetical protein [Microbulbifer aggregans]